MTSDGRDELEGLDPALIPMWHVFPIEKYAAILNAGQAAASQKRYVVHEDALRDMQGVVAMLRYYRTWHPEIAVEEFLGRCWESREDGRWRWAILPQSRPHRMRRTPNTPALGHPR